LPSGARAKEPEKCHTDGRDGLHGRIFSVPLGELPKTNSILTLVGGRTAYDAKAL
jgi:hypothetical protein